MSSLQQRFSPTAPWMLMAGALLATVVFLRMLGRLWICACGTVSFWISDAWSSNNSQHLFDPYSFSHVEHGILFFGLTWILAKKLSWQWRLAMAVVIECAWEVLENSPIIIDRYRTATAALNYTGDTIVNSLGDVISMILGFFVCKLFGWRWGMVTILATEGIMLFLIRDNLFLNILLLLVPIPAIQEWQMLIH